MTEPTPIWPTGPVLRAVVALRLPVVSGAVSTPEPTMEYGGIPPVPAGTVVRLDVGAARNCSMHEADKVAGALAAAAEIEVVGTDPQGVNQTRTVLAEALRHVRLRQTG